MLKFYKYHGLGNDFIIIDNRDGSIRLDSDAIIKLCSRSFGIGADGVVLAESVVKADFLDAQDGICPDIKMTIYNSDGSRAEMCGNAMRCFSKYAYEKLSIKKEELLVDTIAGVMKIKLKVSQDRVESVTVNMGKPNFESGRIPCTLDYSVINSPVVVNEQNYEITSVLMGVPHTVLFLEDIADDNFILFHGRNIEKADIFPQGTNVNFVKVINPGEIAVKTWERGAGYTYACGTGACACVVAGIQNNLLDNDVLVHLRGGDLKIYWSHHGDVFMEGTAVEVFEGRLSCTP